MTTVIGERRAIADAGRMPRPDFAAIDFNQAPFLVIWEATRACALA